MGAVAVRSRATMAASRHGTLVLALSAVAWLGCQGTKKSIEALESRYGPAIERNLAAWPAIEKALRNQPPLAQDGLVGEHAFVVDALVSSDKAANATLCYAEDLASPDELGYVWGRFPGTGALNHCASLLHRGHFAYDPAQPDSRLAGKSLAEARWRYPRCADDRYLFAIRTLEFLPPSAATQASEPFVPIAQTLDLDTRLPAAAPAREGKTLMPEQRTEAKKVTRYLFEGGFLRAEILVFELPSAKPLGGFRFSAQNTVEVDGTDDEIRSDFARQVKAAVRDVLRPREANP